MSMPNSPPAGLSQRLCMVNVKKIWCTGTINLKIDTLYMNIMFFMYTVSY
jgi:hypothetical protein